MQVCKLTSERIYCFSFWKALFGLGEHTLSFWSAKRQCMLENRKKWVYLFLSRATSKWRRLPFLAFCRLLYISKCNIARRILEYLDHRGLSIFYWRMFCSLSASIYLSCTLSSRDRIEDGGKRGSTKGSSWPSEVDVVIAAGFGDSPWANCNLFHPWMR